MEINAKREMRGINKYLIIYRHWNVAIPVYLGILWRHQM